MPNSGGKNQSLEAKTSMVKSQNSPGLQTVLSNPLDSCWVWRKKQEAESQQPLHRFIFHRCPLAAAERQPLLLVHVSTRRMKQIYCVNVRAQRIRLLSMAAINSDFIYLRLMWESVWGVTFDEQPLWNHLRRFWSWLHISSERHYIIEMSFRWQKSQSDLQWVEMNSVF